MIGAIAGDIIGSAYEWHRTKSPDFELFAPQSSYTDDTALTVAVADCILHGNIIQDDRPATNIMIRRTERPHVFDK